MPTFWPHIISELDGVNSLVKTTERTRLEQNYASRSDFRKETLHIQTQTFEVQI